MTGQHCPGKSGFNPRPPFPGGDAVAYIGAGVLAPEVSIHAPRFREAMLAGADVNITHLKVSIHAPRFREAMLISRNYRKHQNKKPALREPLYS